VQLHHFHCNWRFENHKAIGEYKAKTMRSSAALHSQIEAALADRIPSALTPAVKVVRELTSTGITEVDALLGGGLPVGAVTEMIGAECSGRTSLALSFLAQVTKAERVCAWIDVSDALSPDSAASCGVELKWLLWVRCGVQPAVKMAIQPRGDFALPEKYLEPPVVKKGLHGGGFGPHPRNEVKGLSNAVSGFLRVEVTPPRCAEPQRRIQTERESFEPTTPQRPIRNRTLTTSSKPWSRIEQALRVTDLLLHAGGFSAIVLDMGSIAPEYASRVPLATWFRYRAAAERTQTSVVLLTQHACAKSSAGLVLRLEPSKLPADEMPVLTGFEYKIDVVRERFKSTSLHVFALRKPPQAEKNASWHSRTTWVAPR
jgi:recombination protein RecA